jgi:H+-transporting ATPase
MARLRFGHDARTSALDLNVNQAIGDFGDRSFRSLGVCRAEEEGNWQIAVVIPFSTTLRTAKATLASAKHMGISAKNGDMWPSCYRS